MLFYSDENVSELTAWMEPGYVLTHRRARKLHHNLWWDKGCLVGTTMEGGYLRFVELIDDTQTDRRLRHRSSLMEYDSRSVRRLPVTITSVEITFLDIECEQERSYCEVWLQRVLAKHAPDDLCNVVRSLSWRSHESVEAALPARTMLWPKSGRVLSIAP